MRILPEGYTQLEYIEGTGTQYVDTKFIPTPNTKVEIDIDFLAANNTYNCVFGVSQTGSDQFVVYRNGTNMVGQVSTGTYSTSGITNTGRNSCSLSNSLFTYGAYSAAVAAKNFTYTYTLFLFAMNSKGNATLIAHQRLYSCRIYDNGVLIRNYIPCKNASGAVGLYDLVNGVFYDNAGTGAFVAGAIIPEEPDVPPRKVTVDLTPPMTGEKTEDFNINYYVIDDIGTESFAVVEYIDGEETQSRTVTAGETISTLIESTGMDDGLHTFMLIVDETVEVEYTFFVNNSTTIVNTTGVSINLPAQVNINEKFLISVVVTELSLTIAKLKIHAGDIYSGEV